MNNVENPWLRKEQRKLIAEASAACWKPRIILWICTCNLQQLPPPDRLEWLSHSTRHSWQQPWIWSWVSTEPPHDWCPSSGTWASPSDHCLLIDVSWRLGTRTVTDASWVNICPHSPPPFVSFLPEGNSRDREKPIKKFPWDQCRYPRHL